MILAGCFGGGPSAIRVKGIMEATEGVNPDSGGRPSPIVVRIYQLRSPTAFQNADFFALFNKATATLGNDLVRWDEFVLQPNELHVYDTKLDLSTKYLGIFAAYRDYENARWRELVIIPEQKKVPLQITLENQAVSVITD
jgi:type VI secretion system protein VasD